MNTDANFTAEELLRTSTDKELERIFQTFGEEPRSRALAKAIVKDRQSGDVPLSNTVAFAQYVERVLGYHQSRVHPATRVFQALRIAVNQELASVEELLKELPHIMAPKSSVAIISFHSLEDRLVKQYFRAWETGSVTPEDKKAQEKQSWIENQMGLIHSQSATRRRFGQEVPRGGTTASPDEIKRNPRARSARLRGFRFDSEML
jgi:16S rRNA (cytosine1402-N4)-methyltransferase